MKILKSPEILYEDEFLLAVDKPSGMLSVPGRGPEKADCAVSRMSGTRGLVKEVHRLDQATSGILLLAKTPEAHRALSISFSDRVIEKTYIAVTVSIPSDPRREGVVFEPGNPGRIILYQRLDPENRPYQIIDPEKGRKSVTQWRVITADEQSGKYRLELGPLTGRTHQLRLALSTCGAAIPGDSLYASEELRDLSPRLLLHAAVLRFPHPETGRWVKIVSPVPF